MTSTQPDTCFKDNFLRAGSATPSSPETRLVLFVIPQTTPRATATQQKQNVNHTHHFKCSSSQVNELFLIFYLIQHIQDITISTCNPYTKIIELFYPF